MPTPLIDRRILTVVADRMNEAPVVVFQGARSVGKSTVLAELARPRDVEITDLDDPAVRTRVDASPSDAVRGPIPVCIDEYQHVPELLQAVKSELNEQHENGQWLLAGSTSFRAMPRGTRALTGRMQILEVMPFSQGQLDSTHEDFLDVAFDNPAALSVPTRTSTERQEYEHRVCRGGMPLADRPSAQHRRGIQRLRHRTPIRRQLRAVARGPFF